MEAVYNLSAIKETVGVNVSTKTVVEVDPGVVADALRYYLENVLSPINAPPAQVYKAVEIAFEVDEWNFVGATLTYSPATDVVLHDGADASQPKASEELPDLLRYRLTWRNQEEGFNPQPRYAQGNNVTSMIQLARALAEEGYLPIDLYDALEVEPVDWERGRILATTDQEADNSETPPDDQMPIRSSSQVRADTLYMVLEKFRTSSPSEFENWGSEMIEQCERRL